MQRKNLRLLWVLGTPYEICVPLGADFHVLDTVIADMLPLEGHLQFHTTTLCYFRVLWYLGKVPIPPLDCRQRGEVVEIRTMGIGT